MKTRVAFLTTLAVVATGAAVAHPGVRTQELEMCGTPGIASGSALAGQDSVLVSIAYVAFPDQADTLVPPFWQELERVFADYFLKMSHGRHLAGLQTLLRRGSETACYLASSTYAEFNPATDLPGLCTEVVAALAREHTAALAATDVLVLAFLQDCLPGVSGVAYLPCAAGAPFRGQGILVDMQPKEMFFGLVAHEYAHLLGFVHPPGYERKYFGDYCLMDAKVHRLVPLCVENLSRVGWLDSAQVVEVTDTLWNVALADVRRGGRVLRIFATPNQYFWVSNHQGTDHDSVYAGRGLLIWHIKVDDGLPTSGPEVWDVESAAGLYTAGVPDPVAGLDSLDLSPECTGSAADFFQAGSPTAGGHHFGPLTNPSSQAYRLVEGSVDSLVQDVDTGVALRIRAQKADTLFVDVFVPNQPPQFGRVRPLPVAIAAREHHVVECEVFDDHRVKEVALCYAQDSLAQFHRLPMVFLGHRWWQGVVPPQEAGTSLRYFLVARDASDCEARLPEAGFFASSVQGRVVAAVHPEEISLFVRPRHCGEQALQLTNRGDGLMLFRARVLPEGGGPTEALSPPTEVVPHALDPGRWWDAAEVRVASDGELLATIKLKNSTDWLFLRQQCYFLRQADRYVMGIQFKSGPESPRISLIASSPSQPSGQEQHWYAEPAFTVEHGQSVDEHGLPCTVMEARIALQALAGPEETWPRLSFFAQQLGDHPVESRAVAWPPPGQGYDGSDLALLRTDALVPWVEVAPAAGAVPPGAAVSLVVRCCAQQDARARLVVTTNAPRQPNFSLPLRVHVAAGGEGLLFVYPNPSIASATIVLNLQQDCAAGEVAVYDLLGRRVRLVARGPFEAGRHRLSWDGKDSSGRPVPSGVYLVQARLATWVTATKLVRLR
ncbi:MAG: T9SS type A sorting domain-containing protein [Calditrichaeota bacterium]|nr:T9SS type A sorting domain-containing protein [Calditrichota bacterium]